MPSAALDPGRAARGPSSGRAVLVPSLWMCKGWQGGRQRGQSRAWPGRALGAGDRQPGKVGQELAPNHLQAMRSSKVGGLWEGYTARELSVRGVRESWQEPAYRMD